MRFAKHGPLSCHPAQTMFSAKKLIQTNCSWISQVGPVARSSFCTEETWVGCELSVNSGLWVQLLLGVTEPKELLWLRGTVFLAQPTATRGSWERTPSSSVMSLCPALHLPKRRGFILVSSSPQAQLAIKPIPNGLWISARVTATSPLVPLAHGVGPVLLKGSHEFYVKLNSHTKKSPPRLISKSQMK